MTIAAGLPTGPEDAEWRAIWRAVLAAGFELDQRRDVQGIYHRQVKLYTRILNAGAKAGDVRVAIACERCGDDADVDGGLPRIPHRGARSRTEPENRAAADA